MKSGPSVKTLTTVAENWIYLTWWDKLEVIGRVALKKYHRMSRRKKALIVAACGLAAGAFFATIALAFGTTSPEFREVMYAFALGLLIGSVTVYFIIDR